jgi:hypothetical protein
MIVVLVNGLPGAGKTTVARALGQELGLPVFSKDDLRETPADLLEQPPGVSAREWSRRLGMAAGESRWTLLARRRYESRVRHAIHCDADVDDARWREWLAGAEPLGLGSVYWLDTSKSLDISGLAELCAAPQ